MYFLRLDILKQKPIGDTSISANDTTQSDVVDPISSSIRRTSSSFNSSPSGAQPRRKTGVIAELSDSLRNVGIAKNDRKRLYDAGVQATQQKENLEKETTRRLEICTTSEVEKMRIQTNRELELRRLMLEERRLAIQERQLGIIPIPSLAKSRPGSRAP